MNDAGVWGEDPIGHDDVLVVRSTDIRLDGTWDLSDVAERSVGGPDRVNKRLAEGDLVVVKSSGSAQHLGKTAIVDASTARLKACFANFVQRLRPSKHADPRYVWYLLNSRTAAAEMEVLGNTTTGLRNLNGSIIGAVTFPGAPLHQQRQIADFLDAETARVDALIAKKRTQLALLDERRWAVLAAEVTASSAPVTPLRRALVSLTDGPFGSAFSSSDYSDEGVAVVRLGNIGFAEWRGEALARIPLNRFEEFRRHRVREGDLLIAGLGDASNHAGRACVAPDLGPAIVKGKCFCARVDRSVAIPEYLAMFCSSSLGADVIAVEAHGSTRSMINLDIVKAVPVPMPDVATQRAIVAKVNRVWGSAKAVERGLVSQLGLLQEHRQAVITAAVTGELEVA